MNFQTSDNSTNLNQALFRDNGDCGYVLKPEILRNSKLNFDPLDLSTMKNKLSLKIKILSGQQLPQNTELIKDISDPYVAVKIYGIKADCQEKKTRHIENNGFNPIWNEEFDFVVNCPELAFVKFTVKDEDVGRDQLIGHYVIRLESMRKGYRHFQLNNKNSKGALFVFIDYEPLENDYSLTHL